MRLIVAVLTLGFVFAGSQFASHAAATPEPRPMKAEDLKKWIDSGKAVTIVDAREDLDGEIVKGAVQVTDVQLGAWSEKAPKDSPIVFYCTCEHDELAIDAGKPVAIVDAREELDGEILKGAVQVTEMQLVNWSESAPKDSPIVFYCTCEHDELAIDAVVGMENLGFTNTYYLEGGLEAARKAGIAIVKPAA